MTTGNINAVDVMPLIKFIANADRPCSHAALIQLLRLYMTLRDMDLPMTDDVVQASLDTGHPHESLRGVDLRSANPLTPSKY